MLKLYLHKQLDPFDKTVLWSPLVIKEGAWVASWWIVPAAATVWLTAHYLPSYYLETAISEGIGLHLWNVFGILGFAFFGLALLFPRSKFIARSANQAFINAFGIGGLSLGLLFGQIIVAFASAPNSIPTWTVWLHGAKAILLAALSILLNLALWYLGHLMAPREHGKGFLYYVEHVDLRLRAIAFILFGAFPLILLLLEP